MYTFRSAAKKAGVHPNTLRNRANKNSPYHDPTFPQPIQLGDFPNAAKRIPDDEFDAWLASKREARKRI